MVNPLPSASGRHACAGVTLVEAMVCVLLLGVLASLAGPAWRDLLQRQRVAAARAELQTALQLARWEAVRRSAPVALRRRTDCTALLRSLNDWHCGWDIVDEADGQAQVLQRFTLPAGVRLAHANGAALQFNRGGMPTLVAHRFTLDTPSLALRDTTVLCLNRTGRVRTVQGQTTC